MERGAYMCVYFYIVLKQCKHLKLYYGVVTSFLFKYSDNRPDYV